MEALLGAWSLASLLSRFYMLVCSVVSLLVIGAWYVPSGRPTRAVATVLDALGIDVPDALPKTASWIDNRASDIALIATVVAIIALLWSFGFLFQLPYWFDKVRGPGSFWLAQALLSEARGINATRSLILSGLIIGVAVLAINAVVVYAKRQQTQYVAQPWAATQALFALYCGILLVPFLVPLALLHGLGGMPSARTQSGSAAERSTESS